VTKAVASDSAAPVDPALYPGYQPRAHSDQRLYQLALPAFSGPLDLLLYLIRKHKVSIYDIPVAVITSQYVAHIELMQELDVELASEFLVLAAELIELKARLLVPREAEAGLLDGEGEGEEDPRAELARRLLEYERYREAALRLDERPRVGRDLFEPSLGKAARDTDQAQVVFSGVDPFALISALGDILKSADGEKVQVLQVQKINLRQRMEEILERCADGLTRTFSDLFIYRTTRLEIVITFLAILELTKMRLLNLHQAERDGMIFVVPRYQTLAEALEQLQSAREAEAAVGTTEVVPGGDVKSAPPGPLVL
jgi:segregation and condensation protein A